MNSRCHYGCTLGRKCLGITREEMIERIMKYDSNTFALGDFNIMDDDYIQKLADEYADINVDLGHIKK